MSIDLSTKPSAALMKSQSHLNPDELFEKARDALEQGSENAQFLLRDLNRLLFVYAKVFSAELALDIVASQFSQFRNSSIRSFFDTYVKGETLLLSPPIAASISKVEYTFRFEYLVCCEQHKVLLSDNDMVTLLHSAYAYPKSDVFVKLFDFVLGELEKSPFFNKDLGVTHSALVDFFDTYVFKKGTKIKDRIKYLFTTILKRKKEFTSKENLLTENILDKRYTPPIFLFSEEDNSFKEILLDKYIKIIVHHYAEQHPSAHNYFAAWFIYEYQFNRQFRRKIPLNIIADKLGMVNGAIRNNSTDFQKFKYGALIPKLSFLNYESSSFLKCLIIEYCTILSIKQKKLSGDYDYFGRRYILELRQAPPKYHPEQLGIPQATYVADNEAYIGFRDTVLIHCIEDI